MHDTALKELISKGEGAALEFKRAATNPKVMCSKASVLLRIVKVAPSYLVYWTMELFRG